MSQCSTKVLLLAAVLLAPNAALAQSGDPMRNSVSFVEDFSTFFRSRWQISHGWANGPPQDCSWSTSNVKVNEKKIALLVTDQHTKQRSFSCAEVQSRAHYGYGTYEVRIRPAAAAGVVSSFYLYVSAASGQPHQQISIEFVGKDPRAIVANYNAGAGHRGHRIALDFDSSDAVNSYAFQWTPEGILWFVNGHVVYEVKAAAGEALPSYPGKIIMTNWNGTVADQLAWLGPFEYAGQPIVATVEHVAYTRLGEPCQFATAVACSQSAKVR